MATQRIPPIHCLQSFEALARLRSVSQVADEMSVTPSAVSHRIRQLESQLGLKLFARSDFSLTSDGAAYLAQVRPALKALGQVPGPARGSNATRLRLAVTPTFSRQVLLPRLALFRHAFPDVELILQVSIPFLSVTAEDADLLAPDPAAAPGPVPSRLPGHRADPAGVDPVPQRHGRGC